MPILEYRDLVPVVEGRNKAPCEIPVSDKKEKESGPEEGLTAAATKGQETAEDKKTADGCPREGGIAAPEGDGGKSPEWKIHDDKGSVEKEDSVALVKGDVGSKDEEAEKPRRSLMDRFRSQPVLLVPVGGIAIAVWMFASAVLGGSAPVESVPESFEDTPDGFPVLEPPKVREEPFNDDDVVKMLNESVKDASKNRIGKMNSWSSNQASMQQEAKTSQKTKKKRDALRSRRKKKKRSYKRRRKSGAVERKNSQVLDVNSTPAELAAAPRRPRPPRGAGFYKAGVTISASEGKKKDGKAVIPPGTSFPARLKVGVSTDFAGATVLAEVLEPVGDGKSVVLPKGSLIKGRMRGAGDRIYIDFHTAVSGGKKIALKGYAVTGKLPGITASLKGGPGSENSSRTGSVLSRGSLRTAQGVVGTLGGGSVTGQLVRNVAGESLNEVRQDVNDRTVRTLELQAGTEFQVVVTD